MADAHEPLWSKWLPPRLIPLAERCVRGEMKAQDVPAVLLLLGILLLAIDLIVWPVFSLLRQVRYGITDPGAFTTERGDDLRNFALILATIIGAPFVLWRLWISERQTRIAAANRDLTEQRNLTDRFVKAVELLGARHGDTPVLEQRLGGIYALERLAAESRLHHVQIMGVLCAYIRQNAPASRAREFPGTVLDRLEAANRTLSDEDIVSADAFRAAMGKVGFSLRRLRNNRLACLREWVHDLPGPPEDIRAALAVIARRTAEQRALEREASYRLDLSGACLQAAALERAELAFAVLDGIRLEGAKLDGANLRKACLSGVHLEGASLVGAHLEHARLRKARLESALAVSAILTGADLEEAHLDEAWLKEARLDGARLGWSRLNDARLDFALLTGSRERCNRLSAVHLEGVAGEGSALRFVEFAGVHLDTSSDLSNAFADGSVRLPDDLREGSRPVYHCPEILEDAEFFARWRGWLEAGPSSPAWSKVAPPGFENVEAIPPPGSTLWVG